MYKSGGTFYVVVRGKDCSDLKSLLGDISFDGMLLGVMLLYFRLSDLLITLETSVDSSRV